MSKTPLSHLSVYKMIPCFAWHVLHEVYSFSHPLSTRTSGLYQTIVELYAAIYVDESSSEMTITIVHYAW